MDKSLSTPTAVGRFSLSNVNTKPKVLLSAGIPLLLMMVIGAVALINLARMETTQGWVDHTQDVLSKADGINRAATSMESGLRGFSLAGEEQFLEPYTAGAERALSGLAELRETVSDSPEQVARLQQAEETLREWQTNQADRQIALRREIGEAPTMNELSVEMRFSGTKAVFDTFGEKIAAFIAGEEARLADGEAALAQLLDGGTATDDAAREALNQITQSSAAIASAKDILAAGFEMQAGLRGFLVGRDEGYLTTMNAGDSTFHTLVDALSETVSEDAAQVALLGEAKAAIDGWLADIVPPLVDMRREIGVAKTMQDMADFVGEGHGKVYFDEFRTLLAEFSSIEEELMESRQAQNDSTRSMTVMAIVGVLIAALVIGIATALFIGSNIGGAVKSLTDLMRRLADGDNTVEITGQERGDEVGEMARATEIFKQNAIRVAKLNKEQEEASKKMAELAAEREKAAQREVEAAKEKEESDRKAAEEREAMMVDLGKSFGSVVNAALDGEFSRRVDAKFSDKILNELAENINQLMGAVDDGLSKTGQVLERVADGDLTQRMEGDFRGAFGRLQGNVNDMMDGLKSLIMEITGSGATLAESSSELRDTADALSKQAEQNAASLEETSAALEELSASIKQVSHNVTDASKNAQTARDTAQSSEKIAEDAAASMNSIADASKEITRVVGVIDDIAFQINLLALNAGVEAARAGDAGRGFSVVASEVRQLAQRAGEASKEIATVITKSDTAVAVGVEKVAGAQKSLEAIAQSVIDISKGVEDISSSINEQVIGIGEITTAVGQIDQNTQKQAASFEEVTAASTVLANEAGSLQQSTARFRTGQDTKVVAMNQPPVATTPSQTRPKIAAAGGGGGASHEGWDEF